MVFKETSECIGFCGISHQTIDSSKELEIGYRLAKHYWRQGLATEAACACKDLGFSQFKLTRLISIIEAKNGASIRVAEKIGMQYEKDSIYHAIPVRIYSINKN